MTCGLFFLRPGGQAGGWGEKRPPGVVFTGGCRRPGLEKTKRGALGRASLPQVPPDQEVSYISRDGCIARMQVRLSLRRPGPEAVSTERVGIIAERRAGCK